MVDLGQKKVNASLPFFMFQIFFKWQIFQQLLSSYQPSIFLNKKIRNHLDCGFLI